MNKGKFREYHDRLFDNFGQLDKVALIEHAASLDLDQERFDNGMLDPVNRTG